MRELSTEIRIDCPPATVWQILTDFAAHKDWNPFMRFGEGSSAEEGQRLVVTLSPPGGKAMTFAPTVTRVRHSAELRWLGKVITSGVFDGEHVFEISEIQPDKTLFIQREEFRGLLVPVLWKKLETETKAGFIEMNEALKKYAELQHASSGIGSA